MLEVNLSSPIEVRNAGMKALQEALGPVGMVKFMIWWLYQGKTGTA